MIALACLLLFADRPLTLAATDDKPPAVAAELAKSLDAMGMRISDGDDVAMTFWFRATLPATATATAAQIRNGLTYRELVEGSFVGVVSFEKPFTDYRKQEIAAGDYTLRLGLQPAIGDHAGTAPHPDFLMLLPLADDTTLDPLDGKTLLKLSAKATGGDHPGVMLLFPQSAKQAEAKLVSKGGGVSVLTFTRKLTTDDGPATIGFAVTVRGHSASR